MIEPLGTPTLEIEPGLPDPTLRIMKVQPLVADIQNFGQDVFDTVREPLLVLDAALRVRSANTSFYRTFLVSPAETENRLIYQLGNGQWDIPALRTLLEDIVPTSSVFNDFVLEHDFPFIGRRIMLLNARKLHEELVLLALEDVTERRRAQSLLEQIETYAQDVVDTVREPLLILDSSLRVHSANRAFYQTFHVSSEETENRLIYELGNGQWDIPALRTLLEDIVPKSSVFNDFELEHDFPVIGRRGMLLNARKLRQGSHAELLVLAMEDVTERRRAEAEVAKAKEAAETANRTKSLFLANMSHELRTPLNAILGFSEMLREEAVERNLQDFDVDLQKISIAGKHLLGLINDILDLSKIEAGRMELHLETIDICALVEEVASTLDMQVAKNGNTLAIECIPPKIGHMHADLSKVRQGLFNLVSNAAKFTHGGQIRIDAERQTMDGSDWIMFRVSDTGIGLSSEQITRLFQSFTQADASTTRKFGGTGLGLALTRRFCQMMNGDVTVHSVLGKGSVFTIKLPGIVEELAVEQTVSTDDALPLSVSDAALHVTETPPAIRTCVLVIDDDPFQRDLMQRYLKKEGFSVCTASGGADGVRLARKLLPAAITLDVMMPEMDGWSVLSTLKGDAELRDIPVIMLTMVDDPQRGFSLGASDYATKPVNRSRLSHILKKYTCLRPPCPVLVVDDDAATRSITRGLLESEGWAVSEARDGIEALTSMEHERPSLILLELAMPGMDGFAFAAEVRRHPEWRSIPIVVVTAKDLTSEDRRKLNGNVEHIVQKQGDSKQSLLEQVRDLLADSSATRLRTGVAAS
jgi:signal transduction histidine kinase/CheY-like chemotaxis protein